ncbi:formylmethanofuran dehydrogenase [Cupriavidus sp. IK-TO18]|uniref:formylmethanofuran dehydrogenase n=1 Tax=Cupriavidus sp. IK-TO18 TaxID=2782182 RepID=UPI0018997D40|nr:formylmethanofuran dehydrogenase [Cupriavidus sp. IK-TO18]MBF6989203.1 formylmethanofuran dehydrogenase [Cupriavidus sp. IK-TO18]
MTDWTCPFCALLCDGLSVTQAAGKAPALAGDACPRATRALAAFDPQAAVAGPCADGRAVALPQALDTAARLLAASRRPLFGGLATDVAGARALYALANQCAAVLDHAHGDAMTASLRALQDRGAFTTTLAEVRARADLIVCIGTQPSHKHPEFFRRCGLAEAEQPCAREIVFVGTPVDAAAAALPDARCGAIDLPGNLDLYQAVALLNALCRPRALPDHGIAPAPLRALADRLRAARYAVLVWTPSTLVGLPGGKHAALLIEGIHHLIKTLNRSTRAGGLSLGGDDGGNTVNQALTWLSGLPLRTQVHRQGLDHDPHGHAGARLLREHSVDALLWVASFTPDLPPPASALPTVVLGHPALAASMADRHGVFIPVATPGIGAAGHLFRTDGGIVLPLRPLREDGLPTVAEVATQLLARITRLRPADAAAALPVPPVPPAPSSTESAS